MVASPLQGNPNAVHRWRGLVSFCWAECADVDMVADERVEFVKYILSAAKSSSSHEPASRGEARSMR